MAATATEAAMGSCAFEKLFAKSVPHVLEKIFLSLDYESLKNCLEVNIIWRELLTSETYQRKIKAKFQIEMTLDQQELWYAASANNVEKVNRLLSCGMLDINLNFECLHGPPLFRAAVGGHKEVVQILLNRGANPNKRGFCGRTPLHGAAMQINARKGHEEVVQLLLDRRANPNNSDDSGGTPLGAAAAYGHTILVQLLLAAGADPDKKNNDGWTPLHFASDNGYKDTVQELLDGGACQKMQTGKGSTSLLLAQLHGHTNVAKIIEGHTEK